MKQYLPIALILITVGTAIAQQKNITEFTPLGYTILDSAIGDLNQDGYEDYIVILKSELEPIHSDATRPLAIFHGQHSGKFVRIESNDSIVLCVGCGGVFGDPYVGLSVNENFFSINHYSGSAWRWTRVITFKYDNSLHKYILYKDDGLSYHTSDPEKTEYLTYNKEDWDKTEFVNYNTSR